MIGDSLRVTEIKSEITLNTFAEFGIIDVFNKDLVGELMIRKGIHFENEDVKELARKENVKRLNDYDEGKITDKGTYKV